MSAGQDRAPLAQFSPDAAKLVDLLGEDEAKLAIGRLFAAAIFHAKLRRDFKQLASVGHDMTANVQQAAFMYGIPECCIWRTIERPNHLPKACPP